MPVKTTPEKSLFAFVKNESGGKVRDAVGFRADVGQWDATHKTARILSKHFTLILHTQQPLNIALKSVNNYIKVLVNMYFFHIIELRVNG